MKTHRPRPRVAATTKRLAKPRFTSVETSPLRALYAPDAEPYVPSVEELVIPLSERRTIQTLTPASCRWPIGDPQLPDFHFCNCNKVPGLPYCEFHARRAFQPPQPRRRERELQEPQVLVASVTAPLKDPVEA